MNIDLQQITINNFTLTNIALWLVFGFIVGIIANLLDPRPAKGGWLGATILGVLGALVGGFISTVFFNISITGFNLQSFAIALGGALLLVLMQRLFMRDNKHIRTETMHYE